MAYIFLDAGHGGYDTGFEYQGRLEKNDNLDLTLAIGELLSQNGIDVGYTRVSDVYDSPIRRVQMVNETDADLFISIHRNLGDYPNAASGVQILVYESGRLMASIADAIGNELAEAGYDNLGIFVKPDIIELRETRMTAVMLNIGYINSEKDNNLIDHYFNNIVYAVANAIYSYLYDNEIPKFTTEDMIYPVTENIFRGRLSAAES